ncbi:uncharacterized protein FA14DRAFT_156626 [Meira miltonrushii]|uniref:Uncharacterized protein n=1 Tax=Meira miltonrushii TaxID=1280837 RepID=A0A316V8M6_9BASI|nr:uncharacterized protein FA14DRAFT_156626 [Meira miltonrushii]PWN33949.1 hypothetical protein FA14DRAFT_156626 [Meira miltonrushii]
MVAFFSHSKLPYVLPYIIASMILSAYTAPVMQSTTKLIKRGDFFLPPPNYASNGNYNTPKYRSDTPGHTHRSAAQSNQHHSERSSQKAHSSAQPAKSRWTGLEEMNKTSLKRTGSQENVWWQGSSHGNEGGHKRKKNEYNFRSAK